MKFDLEKSLKAKIRQIATDSHQDPLAVWQNLFLERFLVRLARSSYQNHFVLKGGHLLSKYIPIGRETQDLDFFAKNLKNEVNTLDQIFTAIVQTEIDDGFEFKDLTVRPLAHPHMTYLGAHISLMAFFGKIRCKVTIDLGFADIVKEVARDIPLLRNPKGPLFENSVRINCYPQEFIFAEKLETVVFRGAANSRMKDFHDLYSMIMKEKNLNLKDLENAIALVFTHRKTRLKFPLTFSLEEMNILQSYWTPYYQELNLSVLKPTFPLNLAELINVLNNWLSTNIKSCL